MPETTVDKNGESDLWENEVWFAEQLNVSTPTRDAPASKKVDHH
jgi:hypothetical protein